MCKIFRAQHTDLKPCSLYFIVNLVENLAGMFSNLSLEIIPPIYSVTHVHFHPIIMTWNELR